MKQFSWKANGKLDFSWGGKVALDNPIVFVMIGEWDEQEVLMINGYFGCPESIIFVGIGEKTWNKDGAFPMIHMAVENNGNLICSEDKRRRLEKAIRKTKRHQYTKKGEVNVCLLIKNYMRKATLKKWCDWIYRELEQAYFNRITFDVFYLMREEFTLGSIQNRENYDFLQNSVLLEKEEYIRFIFLVSEMTNEDMLGQNNQGIFQGVLDTIMLGNCQMYKNILCQCGIYDQLFETSQQKCSKILTMGRLSLEQPEPIIKLTIQYELVKNILKDKSNNHKYHEPGEQKTNLEMFFGEINKETGKLRKGVGSIAYNPNFDFESGGEKTHLQILEGLFGIDHQQYIDLNRLYIMEECKEATDVFCRNSLELWLNNEMRQTGVRILDESFIEDFSCKVCNQMKVLQTAEEKRRKEIGNRIFDWQFHTVKKPKWWQIFKKKESYDEVLLEWLNFQIQQLTCEIKVECLFEMQKYVNGWRDRILSRIQILNQYCLNIERRWALLLKDCSRIERKMFETYEKNLALFMQDNFENINSLFREICDIILKPIMSEKMIKFLMEKYMGKLYADHLKRTRFYSDWEKISESGEQRNIFYSELYEELMNEKHLQMRGRIDNIEPYICFLGDIKNEFIKYIADNKADTSTIYHMDYYKYPVIMYYQNIESVEQLFAYYLLKKEFQTKGDDGNGMGDNGKVSG